jgi:hypothetical protein
MTSGKRTDDIVDRFGERAFEGEKVDDVDDEGVRGLGILEHREEIGETIASCGVRLKRFSW